MSATTNSAIVHRWFAEFNQGNLAAADEIYAPDYVLHDSDAPADLPPGPLGVKQFITPLLTAFPDAHRTIEDIVCEGDKVVTRFTVCGTHRGEFQGLAPTGKSFAVAGISILRFMNGQIAEEWEVFAALGLLQQLGAFPAPTPAQLGQLGDI